ncbi:hypothetical protein EXE48_12135 [Halorubrum sp. ASP1]|uniref:hypothetical protein n=1 Tax=Halorubrum sp. ASP1 TaxID=2518114 RepID=UPI0010F8165A|nr:hypothetical protein [Halorubrum sp. ASP1]TKX60714.1 hypothetical protein EXE48_12135 [Halorubrum sp. ASP1]
MKEDNRLTSSSTGVSQDGIVVQLNWNLLNQVAFCGLLLVGVLVLAVDGTLLFNILKQVVLSAVAIFIARGNL